VFDVRMQAATNGGMIGSRSTNDPDSDLGQRASAPP
jgi:hypothetical protein